MRIRRGQSFANVVLALCARAAEEPERCAFRFLSDGEEESIAWTYAELDRSARALGAYLQELGAARERILLLFPPGLEFIAAFFGCLYAGAVAVPASPPRRRGAERLGVIAANAHPRFVLTSRAAFPPEGARQGMRWIAADEVPSGLADAWRMPAIDAASLALLQYTSGSTSLPKGVEVTHGNLAHNERLIQQAFRQDESSVVVGWLPLYHDMGLMGNVLQPLWVGSSCILMPPTAFLQKPVRWLAAISRYRAATSGGPNFAYDLCVRRIPEEERAGLDLTSWKVAFNGSEPVRRETLERFAEAFGPCGFRREAFFPCYGLAEATLLVTGAPERGASAGSSPLVSCGPAGEGVRLAIVEPGSRCLCGEGELGEIWVAGSSVARGYWNRPQETEETFRAHLADSGEGPFLRTGDLGFLAGGDLYLAGRLKDLIIIRGRNHHPPDIELTAESSHPALRAHASAAFSLDADGEERLALVLELERTFRGDPAAAAGAVRLAVAREHKLEVFDLVLAPPGAIPRTTSGKIRRRDCRELLLAGELAVIWRAGGVGAAVPAAVTPIREELLALGAERREERVKEWLRHLAAEALQLDAGVLSEGGTRGLALDSVAMVALQARIETALRVSVPLEMLFETPDLGELAAAITVRLEGGAEEEVPEPVALPGAAYPASGGQRALWYLHRLAPENAAYHIAVAVRLPAGTTAPVLRRHLRALVARHTALSSVFAEENGTLMVREQTDVPLALDEIDAGGLPAQVLGQRLRAEARRPFDLERSSLRAALFTDSAGSGPLLLITFHHAVADFESLAVLARDLGGFWSGALPPSTGPPLYGFADFVDWQRRWTASPAGERAWEYWRRELTGLPQLDLPADRPRPPMRTDHGAMVKLHLPVEIADRIGALAGRTGATHTMVIQAALEVLLARLSSQADFPVGFVVSGRRPEFDGLVGYCVNTVILRARLVPAQGAVTLVREVRRTLVGALEHQTYPFVRLAERLHADRDPSRSPLFQVLVNVIRPAADVETLGAFVLQEPGMRASFGGLTLETYPLDTATAQFDLALTVAPLRRGMGVALSFNTDLFDTVTAVRWLDAFGRLLAALVHEPERPLSRLDLLSAIERQQVLAEWSAGSPQEPVPVVGGLYSLFAAQAAKQPDAVAVLHGEEVVTYRALAQRALGLAAQLRSLGAGPEVPVGLCLRRTPDMVAALLGTLAAGAAYVPLDPAYPAQRTQWVLADSGAPILVTERLYTDLFAELPQLQVLLEGEGPAAPDGFQPQPADPDQLAYIIYTSGSTGRPKGVAIRHGSAVARCRWAAATYSATEMAAVLAATSICFDLSVFEIFATLGRGGTVVLAENALELGELPARHRVTLINTVPSALSALLAADALPVGVRVINLAGEPLPRRLVEPLLAGHPERRLFNLYGPSEDTTYSTGRQIVLGEPGSPGIGRPLPGTRAYVMDRDGAPVLPGVPGDLHLGGAGLARGYHRRPDLTAERFIPDPLEHGGRLFRTGDLVRHRPDGDLEFLGRHDHQVKIRGFRIELGEVEATLEAHPAVAEAVAMACEDAQGDRRLVVFAGVRAGAEVSSAALCAHLAGRLPEPMVPASEGDVVMLAALPRTPNGKVDRAALRVPARASRGSASSAVPATPLERELATLWAEFLGVSEVARDDGFFALGGHSLMGLRLVARVRERLGIALPLVALLRSPTVAGLAREIESLRRTATGDETPLVRGGWAQPPLSFAQERLWFLDRLQPGSPAYNVPIAVRLSGRLSVPALSLAAAGLAARHEVLRTAFASTDGRPFQQVAPQWSDSMVLVDLVAIGPRTLDGELRRVLHAEAARPFDLERGPVFRSLLVRLAPREHVWLATVHHIAFDGWSVDILLREVAEIYEAALTGRPAVLPRLPVQYADYAVWQRSAATHDRWRDIAFWQERLAEIPVLQLPTDRSRPAVPSRSGGLSHVELPAAQVTLLREIAAAESTSLFTLLLACFRWLLRRHSGQGDFGIGTPVANRDRAELQGLIGLFANMLVLRTEIPEQGSFLDLLRRERERTLDAWTCKDIPFEQVVEALTPQRELGSHPLFQVSFTVQPAPAAAALPALEMAAEAVYPGAAKFDLSLLLRENRDGGIQGDLEYRRDLFDAVTLERLAGHFVHLTAAVAANPAAMLAELQLLAEAERHQVLHEWNRTTGAAPAEAVCVHELVAEHARREPGAPAVDAPDGRLTYGEMLARADGVAHRLRALGADAEAVVAVCLERTTDLIVSLLGVLRAGAAYLPLDLSWPEERLISVLREARPRAVVTRGLPPRLWGAVPCVDPSDAWAGAPVESLASPLDPAQLAYVIYTSGSTGRPKGIGISHASLAGLVRWHRQAYRLSPAARATQIASPAFDASVWEIWPYLASGACLVLLDEESRWSPRRLIDQLAAEGISHCYAPTPLAELALAETWPPGMPLRFLLTGGDRLHRRPGEGLPAALVNHYGPTECTVVTSCTQVTPGIASLPPPIGRPIGGVSVQVLDRGGAPAPPGIAGELWIGGGQLARGYRNDPELTAESFRPDPLGEAGGRLYKTGDLVRWRVDGELEFLGRLDQQVKIRGFRIELGDIEAALLAHREVREAAAVVRPGATGDARLVAYAALVAGASVTADGLRDHLRRLLPDYLVPVSVSVLPALPLTRSGKVDRAALPAPEPAGGGFVAPRNEVEEELAQHWRELLGLQLVSVDDDFFQLGGHSLQVAQLAARVRDTFGVELPLRVVFEAPSVAALAVRVVEGLAEQAGDEALSAIVTELDELQEALAGGRQE